MVTYRAQQGSDFDSGPDWLKIRNDGKMSAQGTRNFGRITNSIQESGEFE